MRLQTSAAAVITRIMRVPPEVAHSAALRALRCWARLLPLSALSPPDVGGRVVMGLRFANPVGLAAGFDKNGEYVDGLGALGFGFVEVGGVTLRAQAGNAKPRVFRLPQAEAIINRMGFNNVGAAAVAANLRRRRYGGVVGINLGKNATTDEAGTVADYCSALEQLYPYGDFFTINVSSPNTQNLREWQRGDKLDALLKAVMAAAAAAAASAMAAPILVKVSPDLGEGELEVVADLVVRHGLAGVIACNTTVARPDSVLGLRYGGERGGLSGKPLAARATEVVGRLRKLLPGGVAIIGVGGVCDWRSAREKFDAGADLVQMYTGLVYRGPGLPREILRGLGGR